MSTAGLARIRRSVATVVALAVIAMQWTIAAHACAVQVDVDGITLVPPIATQPALSISVAAPVLPHFAAASPLFARGAASPLSILFRRLLI
jgi:hypothetical protein